MGVYPSYKRRIEYINKIPYLVHAEWPIYRIKDTQIIKEWLGCDTVFKNNKSGVFMFCEKIEDVDWEFVNK